MPDRPLLAALQCAQVNFWHDEVERTWAPILRRYMDGREAQKKRGPSRRAQQRARALLRRNLSPIQRRELRASKSFTLVGGDGKTYRIEEKSSTNVLLLGKGGKPLKRLCVVFKEEGVPIHDLMLAQKLLLESNPRAFWRIAQVTAIRAPRNPEPTTWRDEDLQDRVDLRARWAAQHLNLVYNHMNREAMLRL